ncbi:MAG: DMT family transporter [Alcanivoracaceae bacterium]|nr:DMT family transporter [Alcanivoracaceae bacterium]
MNKHPQNWKIGLSLSLMVVFFWSTLPVALNISLEAIDAWTLTWVRFFVAAIFTILIILYTGSWRAYKSLSVKNWLWLLLAGIMLIANYVGFIIGLDKTTPANAQVLIQLAPLLMILGGVYVYKETFRFKQKLGAFMLVSGLLLFFNDQLGTILKAEYTSGVLVLIFAAITWAVYALIQKKLHDVLSPQAILTMIYIMASIILLPFTELTNLASINQDQWIAIAYASLNTVGAYAAFAQALKFWQASRVGMIIAMVPVFTLLFINLMNQLLPELVEVEQIHMLGLMGILLIVSGSVIASIGRR